jgi:hypothetical protein
MLIKFTQANRIEPVCALGQRLKTLQFRLASSNFHASIISPKLIQWDIREAKKENACQSTHTNNSQKYWSEIWGQHNVDVSIQFLKILAILFKKLKKDSKVDKIRVLVFQTVKSTLKITNTVHFTFFVPYFPTFPFLFLLFTLLKISTFFKQILIAPLVT